MILSRPPCIYTHANFASADVRLTPARPPAIFGGGAPRGPAPLRGVRVTVNLASNSHKAAGDGGPLVPLRFGFVNTFVAVLLFFGVMRLLAAAALRVWCRRRFSVDVSNYQLSSLHNSSVVEVSRNMMLSAKHKRRWFATIGMRIK